MIRNGYESSYLGSCAVAAPTRKMTKLTYWNGKYAMYGGGKEHAGGVLATTAMMHIPFQLNKTYSDLDEPAPLTLRAYFPMTPLVERVHS
jgi:hypothetical protein